MATTFIPTQLESVNKFAESKKEDFLDILRNSTSESRTTPDDKIQWLWSFSTVRTKEIKEVEEDRMEFLGLSFEERFEHELKKTRTSLVMRAGNFLLSDRISGEEIPDEIKKVVWEKLVFVMNTEQSIIKNDKVINTIPKPKKPTKKGEEEETNEFVKTEKPVTKKVNLNIDDILQKINDSGMESLTDEEREYLQNNS